MVVAIKPKGVRPRPSAFVMVEARKTHGLVTDDVSTPVDGGGSTDIISSASCCRCECW